MAIALTLGSRVRSVRVRQAWMQSSPRLRQKGRSPLAAIYRISMNLARRSIFVFQVAY